MSNNIIIDNIIGEVETYSFDNKFNGETFKTFYWNDTYKLYFSIANNSIKAPEIFIENDMDYKIEDFQKFYQFAKNQTHTENIKFYFTYEISIGQDYFCDDCGPTSNTLSIEKSSDKPYFTVDIRTGCYGADSANITIDKVLETCDNFTNSNIDKNSSDYPNYLENRDNIVSFVNFVQEMLNFINS